jgi:hypothetical protein
MIKRSLVLALVFTVALPALGYIEAMNSLKGVYQESDVIARANIHAVNAEKKVLIVNVVKSLKGKSAYDKIRIDLSAGPEWHGDMVLRHATVGAPVSLFYHKKEGTEDAGVALIYNNRFFMTLQPEAQVWRLGKIELAMSKVYHGTAEELLDLSVKILSGRSKPPEPRADLKAFTKEILTDLPPPPKDGEKWAEFDAVKVLKGS